MKRPDMTYQEMHRVLMERTKISVELLNTKKTVKKAA